jgi:hypothetical protein
VRRSACIIVAEIIERCATIRCDKRRKIQTNPRCGGGIIPDDRGRSALRSVIVLSYGPGQTLSAWLLRRFDLIAEPGTLVHLPAGTTHWFRRLVLVWLYWLYRHLCTSYTKTVLTVPKTASNSALLASVGRLQRTCEQQYHNTQIECDSSTSSAREQRGRHSKTEGLSDLEID